MMRTRGDEMRFVGESASRDSRPASPVEPFAGPLAILIDGLSASTTEMFAAGAPGVRQGAGVRGAHGRAGAAGDRDAAADRRCAHARRGGLRGGGRLAHRGTGAVPDETGSADRGGRVGGADAPLACARAGSSELGRHVRESVTLATLSTSDRRPYFRRADTGAHSPVHTAPGSDHVSPSPSGNLCDSPRPPCSRVASHRALFAAQAPAAVAAAKELIAKFVAATNAGPVMAKHQSVRTKGRFEMPAAGVSGDLEISQARPNKTMMRINRQRHRPDRAGVRRHDGLVDQPHAGAAHHDRQGARRDPRGVELRRVVAPGA